MLFSCPCGGNISISTKLFTTLSITSLDNLCYENRTFSSSNPWVDSVLESGEMGKSEDYTEAIEDDEEEDDYVDIPYTDGDE